MAYKLYRDMVNPLHYKQIVIRF